MDSNKIQDTGSNQQQTEQKQDIGELQKGSADFNLPTNKSVNTTSQFSFGNLTASFKNFYNSIMSAMGAQPLTRSREPERPKDSEETQGKDKPKEKEKEKEKPVEGRGEQGQEGAKLQQQPQEVKEVTKTDVTAQTQKTTQVDPARYDSLISSVASVVQVSATPGLSNVNVTLGDKVPDMFKGAKLGFNVEGKTITIKVEASDELSTKEINDLIQDKMGKDLAKNEKLKDKFDVIKFDVGGKIQEFQMEGKKISKPHELAGAKKGSKDDSDSRGGSDVERVERKGGSGQSSA
jgi:hypothetical protein